ncbi:hypothetical protein LSTR_LSTR009899 [Laodelphax striatellus]|uniref:MADF domain-containing protein n=1 Tax=Laodelphax striatellus TaxID=195883 RepID=A0A482WK20_LAOST|nr:hypothetical protein LSTR_LSTR009899 [Laodelphax striatellus]
MNIINEHFASLFDVHFNHGTKMNVDDEQLIECVKKYPAVYDMSHPKYSDSGHKSAVWKLIGEEIDESETICKKRWINIRDQFKKSLNRRRTEDAVYKRYKYEENLQFLLPHMTKRTAAYELNGDDSTTDIYPLNFVDTHDSSCYNTGNNETQCDGNNFEGAQSDSSPRKKRKKMGNDSASTVLMKYFIEQSAAKTNNHNKHHIDAFLEGLAPTLKSLPPYYQHLAKGRLFSVVHELEAAALFGTSSRPSSPPNNYSEVNLVNNEDGSHQIFQVQSPVTVLSVKHEQNNE